MRPPSAMPPSSVTQLIDRVGKEGDTLGGVVEVRVDWLPIGLGTHAQWDRKLDGRDPRGGLTGAGPFEHRPDPTHVLHGPREVGMARTGTIDIVEPLELGVAVDHLQRQWTAERHTPPQPRQERDGVGLDPLAAAAAIASLPTAEFGVDCRGVDGQPGGKPVHERHEGGAVGFTGSPVTQHEIDVYAGGARPGNSDSSWRIGGPLGQSRRAIVPVRQCP